MNILNYAWQFAGIHQQEFITSSKKLRHPMVSICIDNKNDLPTSSDIRAIKAKIQRNEEGLNIKRVNIYVITPADIDACKCRQIGQLLSDLFNEDFPIVHISLFVLLSESNSQNDFEKISAASLRFLEYAQDFKLYDMIWLLSDRNEHDVVRDENRQNNQDIIETLKFLNTDTNFEDTMKQKGGFATAGLAQLVKPDKEIAFCAFRSAFLHITLPKDPVTDEPINLLEHPSVTAAIGIPVLAEQISHDMESVAATKASGLSLHKKTVREVESILFGDRARLFFDANYKKEISFDINDVLKSVREYICTNGINATSKLWLQPTEEIENSITGYEQEIEVRYQELYTHKPFGGIKKARDTISKIYAVRSKLQRLYNLRDIMVMIHKELKIICDRCENFINQLKDDKALLLAEQVNGLHITEYYEPIMDDILKNIQNEEPYNLMDLMETDSLYSYVADFATKSILLHPSLNLSFEEDLKMRANADPNKYDKDFTNKNEFYNQILKEADSKAALSISLKRYDNLVYEKFYLGDIEGNCIKYAKERKLERVVDESIYFLNDVAGFKLLRLAGGFTLKDLTRYESMVNHNTNWNDKPAKTTQV